MSVLTMFQEPMSASILTEIMLVIFRLNACLLEMGDKLVAPLHLTSARWQVMGAVAMAGKELTAPQIAKTMGITRQGVQKQLHFLMEEGVLQLFSNPNHARSFLYTLTTKGKRLYEEIMTLHNEWATGLVKDVTSSELKSVLNFLQAFNTRLEKTAIPKYGV